MPKARRFSKTFYPDADGVCYELHHGRPGEEVVLSCWYGPDFSPPRFTLEWVIGDTLTERDPSEVIDLMYTYRNDGAARAHQVWTYLFDQYKKVRELNRTK